LFESGDRDLAGQIGGRTQFHRFDLRYDWAPDDNTQLRAAVTAGFDRTRDENGSGAVRDQSLRVRLDVRREASGAVGVDAGVDARLDAFRLTASRTRVDYSDLTALFPSRDDGTGGAYLSLRLRPERRIRFVPGVRADLYAVREP